MTHSNTLCLLRNESERVKSVEIIAQYTYTCGIHQDKIPQRANDSPYLCLCLYTQTAT